MNRNQRIFIGILSVLCFSSSWGMTCYYTLVKDNCWTQYNVRVEVTDAVTFKALTTVAVPAGTSWTREAFSCTPGQKLFYKARFSPPIWESDKDKVYSAITYWSLPSEIKSGETAWNISVCYPASFSDIPLPPDAAGNCRCDFSSVPGIEPK